MTCFYIFNYQDMKELIIYLLFASVAYCEEKTTDESSNVPPIKITEDEVKGPVEDNGILVLTDDNFEETLKSKKLVLVEFYAPWCGHCKALAPEYEKAAMLLAERDPPLKGVLAKIDATVNTKVADKYSIRGYPILKLFREGEEAGDYGGDRNGDDIASFMAERIDPNYKPPPPVAITLTKDNFTEFITNNDYALVKFFTPLCRHCKQFAPIYERAAKQLKEENPPIPLAVVDASQAEEIAAKYKVQVQDFPILKLFRKGEAYDYKGRKNDRGIVEYMAQNRYDAYHNVTTMKALKEWIPESRPLILGYFPAPSQDVLRKVMVDATNDLRNQYTSVITQESAIAKEFGLTEPSVILIQPERFHSKHEPKFIKFDAKSVTVEALQQFIAENQHPLVGHLNWNTMKFYDAIRNETFCTVFFSVDFGFEHRKATQMWRQKLVEVAKDFKGKVVMAIANDEDFEDRIQAFNLVETGVDMNIGCLKRGIRYVMPEMDEYDADHIRSFLRDLLDGKAKPFLRSEKVPAKQTSPVMTAVGDNYEKTVFDLKKDVLVEFYSPDCGHCQMFAPIYEKLAQRLSTIPSLSVIKMNARDNDVPPPLEPSEQITFFPTIYFRAAGSKDLVKFDDSRSPEEMIEFMAKHATTSKQALEAEVAADKKKEKKEEDGGEAKEEKKKDEL